MVNQLPPLKFTPIIKPQPWGGRKLETIFRRVLPPGVPCGESWEIADLPEDQSVVVDGPLAATPLEALVSSRAEELLGQAPLLHGRFPVLFKLLDIRDRLSVQVHPDESACERFGQGARPKAEAWYVLQCEPGARVFLGTRPGVGPSDLRTALAHGAVEELLHAEEVHSGDFVYLPAGTLHSAGGGLLLAEVQQSSDTTYRLFDWNRAGLDRCPRAVHVEEVLASTAFEVRGRPAHATPLSGRPGVRCRAFSFERLSLASGGVAPLEAGRPRILFCIDGAGAISDTGEQATPLSVGQTCLLPACRAGQVVSETGGVFLLVRV